ncbi:MAG: rhodanese-related sulfurtransferase [Algoriphagus sp.]|jgi:rhodanese-related sulfurtransferase
MNEINQDQLAEVLESQHAILVDIREVIEFNDFNIGGINIPSHLLNENLEKLMEFDVLIIACSNGTISHIMQRVFMKKLPTKTILHLTGGIY